TARSNRVAKKAVEQRHPVRCLRLGARIGDGHPEDDLAVLPQQGRILAVERVPGAIPVARRKGLPLTPWLLAEETGQPLPARGGPINRLVDGEYATARQHAIRRPNKHDEHAVIAEPERHPAYHAIHAPLPGADAR